jgi:hypothetical protein
LAQLRRSTLDQPQDDNERAVLGPRLDLHVDDARDGIDRHVAKQQDELTRQIISAHQTLIQRAPNSTTTTTTSSRASPRLTPVPLAAGDSAQAVALFDRLPDDWAADVEPAIRRVDATRSERL